jgi:hypothetical protein
VKIVSKSPVLIAGGFDTSRFRSSSGYSATCENVPKGDWVIFTFQKQHFITTPHSENRIEITGFDSRWLRYIPISFLIGILSHLCLRTQRWLSDFHIPETTFYNNSSQWKSYRNHRFWYPVTSIHPDFVPHRDTQPPVKRSLRWLSDTRWLRYIPISFLIGILSHLWNVPKGDWVIFTFQKQHFITTLHSENRIEITDFDTRYPDFVPHRDTQPPVKTFLKVIEWFSHSRNNIL